VSDPPVCGVELALTGGRQKITAIKPIHRQLRMPMGTLNRPRLKGPGVQPRLLAMTSLKKMGSA
jgi:hypothetical protein